MKKIGQIQAENILKSKKRRMILRRIVAFVAAFVMLFTMHTLKKNANTLERIATCGFEEHIHTEECYDEAGELICGLPEHVHTDACYQAAPVHEEEEFTLGEEEETDLPTEAEPEPAPEPIVEAPMEEEALFELHQSARLSEIIEVMGLPVSMRDVVEAGQVVNNDDEAGRVGVSLTEDNDLLISAMADFDRAELAIITNTDILTVMLANGTVAVETPAEAPAAEDAAEDGQESTEPTEEEPTEVKNKQTEVGTEETEIAAVEGEPETVETELGTEETGTEPETTETEETETETTETESETTVDTEETEETVPETVEVELGAEETETETTDTEETEDKVETTDTEATEEVETAVEGEAEVTDTEETEGEAETTDTEATEEVETAVEGEAEVTDTEETEDKAEATDTEETEDKAETEETADTEETEDEAETEETADTEETEDEAETEETADTEETEDEAETTDTETEAIEEVKTETEDEAEATDTEKTEDEAETTDTEETEDKAEATDTEATEGEAETEETADTEETEDGQELADAETEGEAEAETETETETEETAAIETVEVEQSLSVNVDLSSVDLMQAATITGDTVTLSVSDLLVAEDDAVRTEGDLDVTDESFDTEAFAAEAVVTDSQSDVTVENGEITLSAEALAIGSVTLELQTETTEDDVTTITTQTVDITLENYTGRTMDAIDGDEGVKVVPMGNNSLPNDAYATMTELEGAEEMVELASTDTTAEAAVAYDISIVNDNNDTITDTGRVKVTVEPENLNVYSEVPEGAEPDPDSVDLKLYQLNEDGEPERVRASFDTDDDGNVTSFSFTTDSPSTYVVKYTVDFTYIDEDGNEHFWQFPGTGSRPLTEVLAQLGIEGETITDARLELTEAVDEYGDKDLYLTQDEETGAYIINSDAAFDDIYTLTVTLDGVVYVVTVTDAMSLNYPITVDMDSDDKYPQHIYAAVKMRVGYYKQNDGWTDTTPRNAFCYFEITNNDTPRTVNVTRLIEENNWQNDITAYITEVISIEDVFVAYKNDTNTIDDYQTLAYGSNKKHNSDSLVEGKTVAIDYNNKSATITIGNVSGGSVTPDPDPEPEPVTPKLYIAIDGSFDVSQNYYLVLQQDDAAHGDGTATQYYAISLGHTGERQQVPSNWYGYKVVNGSTVESGAYDAEKAITAYLIRKNDGGTFNGDEVYTALKNNSGFTKVAKDTSFANGDNNFMLTASTTDHVTDVSIDKVETPVTYTAHIDFYDAWSEETNDTANIVSGALKAVSGSDVYEASVTGTGDLAFTKGGVEADLPSGDLTWKLNDADITFGTTKIGPYVLAAPAKDTTAHTYTFEARQPNTYTVSVDFYEIGAAEPSTVTLPTGHTYTIEGVTSDYQRYVATLNESGEVTSYTLWEGAVDSVPEIATWEFKQDSTQTDNFDGYKFTATPTVTAPVGMETTGKYVFTARKQKTLNVTLTYLNGSSTPLPDTAPITMDGNYYLVATAGGAQYFAKLTGSENSYETGLVFKNASGDAVTQLLEGATFELRKSGAAYETLNDVLNNTTSVSSIGTTGDEEYQFNEVTNNGTTYTLTATEFVPSSAIDTIIVQMTDDTGTTPIKPEPLPEKNFYVLAELTQKGNADNVQGWKIFKLERNDFVNDPAGQSIGTDLLKNANFFFKSSGDNWQESTIKGYNPDAHDLKLTLYTTDVNNNLNANESGAYNNLRAQGSTDAPYGYVYDGIYTRNGMPGTTKSSAVADKTAVIRLREHNPQTYGMRVFVDPSGLSITEANAYAVRVTLNYTGTPTYAYGKLIVGPDTDMSEPVELELLRAFKNGRSSIWHDKNNDPVYNVSLDDPFKVEVLSINKGSALTASNLHQSPKDGGYTPVTMGDSINGFHWTFRGREGVNTEEGLVKYDTLVFTRDNGSTTVGKIQSMLSDATNFGLYTEKLISNLCDMEANIGAAELACSMGTYYGFSNNNYQVNQIIVTKSWKDSENKPKYNQYVAFNLYPVVGYNNGTYESLGSAISRDGYTDANGVAEITFDHLSAGYYLLKEVLSDGHGGTIERAFSDGTNGMVTLGDGRTVTFKDGILYIDTINVNVNYFGQIDDGVNYSSVVTLSRHGWIVTDNEDDYQALLAANEAANPGDRSEKILKTGTDEYPKTYNISGDMDAFRTLSHTLATSESSSTVKIMNVTCDYVNSLDYLNIKGDGRFVVVNIDMTGKTGTQTVMTKVKYDGEELKAEFGSSGNEYASKVLFNYVANNEPWDGYLETDGSCAGILFLPNGTVGKLSGNWGGTIICKEADRYAGGEIHSDNNNKIQKINTLVTNAETEQDTGDLNIHKEVVGGNGPDNSTWFTFTVKLQKNDGAWAADEVQEYVATGLPPEMGKILTFTKNTGVGASANEGIATIKVRATNDVTIGGIPTGYTYIVDEVMTDATEHFQLVSIVNGEGVITNTGAIEKGKTASIIATNSLKVGGLTIRKTVIGDATGTKKFHFKVSILKGDGSVNTDFSGRYGDLVFTNGVAAGEDGNGFLLGNGGSVNVTGLTEGTRFKVEELDHDSADFETAVAVTTSTANKCTIDNDTKSVTGTISVDDGEQVAIVVSYTNTHTEGCTYNPEVTKSFLLVQDESNVPDNNWPVGGFTFEIEADPNNPNGATLPTTTTATAKVFTKKAIFDAITFEYLPSLAEDYPVDYTFTITEQVPDEEHRIPGVHYSTTPVTLTVTVGPDDDPDNPKLEVKSANYDGLVVGTITNTYESVKVQPKAFKKLDGVPYAGQVLDGEGNPVEFTFKLTPVSVNDEPLSEEDAEAQTKTATTSATNDPRYEALFEPFEYKYTPAFDTEGYSERYVYTVTEVDESDSYPNIRYDGNTLYYIVNVEKDGEGKLKARDGYYWYDNGSNLSDSYKAVFNNEELTNFHFIKVWTDGVNISSLIEWPKNTQITVTVKRFKSDLTEAEGDSFVRVYTISSDSEGNLSISNPETYPATLARDENGNYRFDISGLDKYGAKKDEWIYYAVETQVPAGFHVKYGTGTGAEYAWNGSITNDGTSNYIRNHRNSVALPATGGVGTTLIYVLGAGLLVLAVAAWVIRTRKRHHDD